MRLYRWSLLALLLCLTSADVHARRSSFVREIVVVSSNTPPPTGEEKWVQVPDRDKLNGVIQHPTPTWRNFWLPVRFDETYLAADTFHVAEYYRNHGYLDATVESADLEPLEADSGMQFVNVVIVLSGIDEGQRYALDDVELNGVRSLDSAKLVGQFRSRHGRDGFFSPAAANENLVDLNTEYADAGYLDSTAVNVRQEIVVDRKRHTVRERYFVTERAPIRVRGFRVINGNAPDPLETDSSVIIQSLIDAKLREGAVFGRQRILDAEANLADLGVFRRARVLPDTVDKHTTARRIAAVDVAERDAWDIRTRVGYSNLEKWRASESTVYNNLFGQARLLGQQAQASIKTQSLIFRYSQPRIGLPRFVPAVGGIGARLRMDQALSAERFIIDDTASTNTSLSVPITEPSQGADSIVATATGDTTATFRWKVTVSRRFGGLGRVGISYDIARTYSKRTEALFVGTVTLSGTYDSRDDYLNPRRGLAITAQVRVSKLRLRLAQSSYRPEVLVQYYRLLNKNLVGAVSVAGGMYYVGRRGEFLPTELFWRSDQTPTVRGATRNDITGAPAMAYLLSKLEARLAIWKKLGAVAFFDAGQGWARAGVEESNLRGFSAMRTGNLAFSVGFGPRYNWILPMRLDFAYPLRGSPQKWKVEFGIGQAF